MSRVQTRKARPRGTPPKHSNNVERRSAGEGKSSGTSSKKPDYDYWGQFALWEFDQFVALSLGFDPEIVTPQAIKSSRFPEKVRICYQKQFALFDSHRQAARFNNPHNNSPSHWLSWAETNALVCPAPLIAAVLKHGGKMVNWRVESEKLSAELGKGVEAHKAEVERLQKDVQGVRVENEELCRELERLKKDMRIEADERELTESERRSVRKIIITMAMRRYQYDPSQPRSDIANKIVSDAAELGLRIDDNTVRDWLRKSATILPKTRVKPNPS